MSFNERLKAIRIGNFKSQEDFADKIGVSRQTISNIERGEAKPSFEIVERILEVIPKINANWLLKGIGEMSEGNTGIKSQTTISVGHENTIIQNSTLTADCLEVVRQMQTKIDQLSGQVQILKELLANK